MKTVSRLKRIEEALLKKQAEAAAEADAKLHAKQIQKYVSLPGHRSVSNLNRRDLLAAGVFSTVGYLLGPSLPRVLSLIGESVFGEAAFADSAACAAALPQGNGPAPFINLHLAGGYQTLSIATPSMLNKSPIPNFKTLGLGETPVYVNNVFSNSIALYSGGVEGQGFLNGLQKSAKPETLSQAAMVTVPHIDNGDSDQRTSILGLVSKSGRSGSKLAFLCSGSGNLETGISGLPVLNVKTSVNPLRVLNTAQIQGALVPTRALTQLSADQQKSLVKAIKKLNQEQASRITGLNGGQALNELVSCATSQNLKNLEGGGPSVNPADIAGLPTLWNNFDNLATPELGGFNSASIAPLVTNVLNGNAAGAAINIGGFDIHGAQNRASQEIGVFNLGMVIGRILESAKLMGSKVFIHITSNGSAISDGGLATSVFNNDDSAGNCCGASHFIAYDPTKKSEGIGDLPSQIGGLNANGRVDKTVFTSNMDDAGAAVFYNYCIFSLGESAGEDLFQKTLGSTKSYSQEQKMFMRKVS